MTLFLPTGLPAAQTLRLEGLDIIDDVAISRSSALRVAFVNLMPCKEASEIAFGRLLASAGRDIEMIPVLPTSYVPRSTSPDHIARYYRRWPNLAETRLDALVVTGAAVETLPFTDVSYWDELRKIMLFARAHVPTALYVCWAAQAALHVFHGIEKQRRSAKAFGVFEQQVVASDSPLVRGLGASYPVPVSRHTAVDEEQLRNTGVTVLARCDETGFSLAEDVANRAVLLCDHLEYDADTLSVEYERDLRAGRVIEPPKNACAEAVWRPHATLLVRNWLDGVATAQTRSGVHDEAFAWLFAGEPRGAVDAVSRLILLGPPRPRFLTDVVARLSRSLPDPASARVHVRSATMAAVVLEWDDLPVEAIERAARSAGQIEGVCRAIYRGRNGVGGIASPHRAARDRAA